MYYNLRMYVTAIAECVPLYIMYILECEVFYVTYLRTYYHLAILLSIGTYIYKGNTV